MSRLGCGHLFSPFTHPKTYYIFVVINSIIECLCNMRSLVSILFLPECRLRAGLRHPMRTHTRWTLWKHRLIGLRAVRVNPFRPGTCFALLPCAHQQLQQQQHHHRWTLCTDRMWRWGWLIFITHGVPTGSQGCPHGTSTRLMKPFFNITSCSSSYTLTNLLGRLHAALSCRGGCKQPSRSRGFPVPHSAPHHSRLGLQLKFPAACWLK